MLDLGTSFVASVARDPDAPAIVDGDVRLTYWRLVSAQISALVAGFDELGLVPGDHLVTLLQNRWEAATIHWACQFAGIIITPLNWRSTADELDFCLGDAGPRPSFYEQVAAEAGSIPPDPADAGARALQSVSPARRTWHSKPLVGGSADDAVPARRRRGLVGDALHLRRRRAAQGRAAPPARGARRGARPCRAESLWPLRAHARGHAALSHHGRAVAAGDVADRRHLRLPAALRRCARAPADRRRENQRPLSRADALSRPVASRRFKATM